MKTLFGIAFLIAITNIARADAQKFQCQEDDLPEMKAVLTFDGKKLQEVVFKGFPLKKFLRPGNCLQTIGKSRADKTRKIDTGITPFPFQTALDWTTWKSNGVICIAT